MSKTNGSYVSPRPQTAVARLRSMLAISREIVTCPGVFDGISARIALKTGCNCLYMTGAGTSMSRLGMADLGITNLSDMVVNAAMIASLDRTVPLIADADTGYGGPLTVARTVREYMAAGVAALHIEDQVLMKRCGHLTGKELVSEQVFLARIKAAVMARDELRATIGSDIVIIARTDSLQSLGYEAAIERLRNAIAVGADVAFLEGMTTRQQCERVCADLAPTPVLLNMVAGGVTPYMSNAEAAALGFKIVIYPAVALGPMLESIAEAMSYLETNGQGFVSESQKTGGVRALFDACGMTELMAFDEEAGQSAIENGERLQ